jgi:hypothetical protein
MEGHRCHDRLKYSVSHFQELSGVEEVYIRPVDCRAVSRALPFDGAHDTTRRAMLVDVDTKL